MFVDLLLQEVLHPTDFSFCYLFIFYFLKYVVIPLLCEFDIFLKALVLSVRLSM